MLLGFSFGGELALEFSLTYPTLVAALILQAPSVGDPEQTARVQLEGFEAVAQGETTRVTASILQQPLPLTQRLERVWNSVAVETVDRFLFNKGAAAKINRQLWSESGLTNTGDMHKALASQQRISLLERVQKINLPALVMVGRHDKNVGVDLCARLVESMPQASLVVFEHSAHFPDLEEPELYTATIHDFYRNLGPEVSPHKSRSE